jgi:hypothetical protein
MIIASSGTTLDPPSLWRSTGSPVTVSGKSRPSVSTVAATLCSYIGSFIDLIRLSGCPCTYCNEFGVSKADFNRQLSIYARTRAPDGQKSRFRLLMSLIENASRRFPDSIGVHPVCFRCGAQHDDGLEVYAAPVGGNDIVAAAWPTKHEWADARGNVPACFIWTALD